MTTITRKLRPFTQSDWDAYSGCETEEPQIAEGVRFVWDEEDGSRRLILVGDLIVDGSCITFNSHGSHALISGWAIEFFGPYAEAEALRAAQGLLESEKITDFDLCATENEFNCEVTEDAF